MIVNIKYTLLFLLYLCIFKYDWCWQDSLKLENLEACAGTQHKENTFPTDQRQWGSPVHEQLCEPSSARSVGGKWLDAWNFWCSDFVHSFLPNETCMYGRCASVKYRMSSTKHPTSKSGVHRCANSTLYVVVLQWVACACLCPYHHYPHYKHVKKSWQRLLRTADCQELYKGCSMTCRFDDLTSHVVLGK